MTLTVVMGEEEAREEEEGSERVMARKRQGRVWRAERS